MLWRYSSISRSLVLGRAAVYDTSVKICGRAYAAQDIAQSAQIKADFADKLGINGIVEQIYSSTYAVHVKMSSLDASLLSNDKRVLKIEPDTVLQTMSAAPAEHLSGESYPMYQEGILTIPRVGTPERAGNYLDATFKQIGQNLWELQGYKTADEYPLAKAPVEQVKLVWNMRQMHWLVGHLMFYISSHVSKEESYGRY